jgi:hypothetical protein
MTPAKGLSQSDSLASIPAPCQSARGKQVFHAGASATAGRLSIAPQSAAPSKASVVHTLHGQAAVEDDNLSDVGTSEPLGEQIGRRGRVGLSLLGSVQDGLVEVMTARKQTANPPSPDEIEGFARYARQTLILSGRGHEPIQLANTDATRRLDRRTTAPLAGAEGKRGGAAFTT